MALNGAILAAVAGNSGLRRLAVGYGIFAMAEHASWVAILVFAYARGGPTEAGLVALVMLVPAALVAPFAATAIDRFPRRRVILAAYLIQAVAMGLTALAMLGGSPAGVVYSAATLASISIVLTRPAQGALLPHLARRTDELTAANAASSSIEGLGTLVGPALAGILLAFADPGLVFLLFAVLLTGSAVLMVGLPVEEAIEVAEVPGVDLPMLASSSVLEGLRTLREQPGPRLVVLVMASSMVLWGAIDVFSVMLALDVLHIGREGAGFLVSAIGAGGLVGSLGAFALVGRRRLTMPVLAGLSLWGLPLALIGILPQAALAFVFLAAGGAARSIMDAAGRTLLQRVASDDALGRVLGILEGLGMAGLAVGSIAAPALVVVLGPRGAIVAAGISTSLVAALAWRGFRAIDTGVTAPAAWLAAVRAIPMFAPLPPAVIERLAGGAESWTAAAGTAIVRQGELGDRFHIVQAGTVEVTVDGKRVRTQGAGTFFGEIALLRDISRTASVTALTAVEILSIAREPFLAALTGHRSSRSMAEAIADARLSGPSSPG